MAGSGIVDGVSHVSDKDDRSVFQLRLQDGPGNEGARAFLTAQRPDAPPAHVAINMANPHKLDATHCPIQAGDPVTWGPHHIECRGVRYDKLGNEIDPDAPLSAA